MAVTKPTIQYEELAQQKNIYYLEKAKAMIIISESQHCSYEPLQRALLHLADGNH